jgi:hypothetical protein
VLIDNDGLHGLMEKKASIALEQGFHAVEVRFFEKTGGDDLVILMEGPGLERQPIPSQFLFH